MLSRRVLPLAVSPFIVGLLSSCGYVHVGRLPAPAPATPLVTDAHLTQENADLRLEKKMLQQELALTRAQGDALRRTIENRTADGDTSKRLTETLSTTSRELATLRENYAQLQRDRDAAVASAAESNSLRDRLAQTEAQLVASRSDSAALQHEIAQLRTEVDRTRAENLALGEQVKTLTARNAEALAAIATLNTDLLAQQDARFRAEQDAETLRTELRTVAPDTSLLAQQRTGAAAEARSLAAEHAAQIAALKRELDASRTEISSLETERADLKRSLGSLDAAAQSNVVLHRENDELKAATAQLQATKAELENQLARLKNGSSAEQVQVLREQLRAAQSRATALTEENSRLKGRVALSLDEPRRPTAVPASDTPAPADTADSTTSVESPVITPAEETRSGVTATLVTRAPGTPRQSASRIELPGRGRVHVVAGGDTLSKISARYYGTPTRWGDILSANRDILGEANTLIIGRALRIP